MDYKDLSDEMLYQVVKARVPEIPIHKVDASNRKSVIAVMKITERIRQRRNDE